MSNAGPWGEAPPPQPPFQKWIDAARPRHQLWRTIVGAILVVAVWALWTIFVLFIAIATGLLTPGSIQLFVGEGAELPGHTDAVIISLVLFATFLGLWLGVWIATALLHKRRPGTVISISGGIRWREFGIGLVIGAVYLAASVAMSLLSGEPPQRTDVDFGPWLLSFAPIALLLFFQSAGEELFFRGYLVQQLAARFRSPLVWGLVPALLFGLAHAANVPDPTYAAYYVAATTMFGLVATATVWRSGSLATAMGLHVVNNVGAFTVAGPATALETQLWVWPDADVVGAAPFDLAALAIMLAYMLSPWAPFPKAQPFARRNEIRAAP
jgi:membrane protease YdiL (CAAX protease family)